MKIYSESDLEAKAKDVFQANPEAKALLATSDGNFFLEGKENAANLHARQVGGQKTPLKIYTIHPAETPKEKSAKTGDNKESGTGLPDANPLTLMTVKEVTAWANKETEIEALNAALEYIITKGGRAAVEDRIKELAADAPSTNTGKE